MKSVVTKHHPTPEERDERHIVDLEPDAFIAGVLAVDPTDEDEGEDDET